MQYQHIEVIPLTPSTGAEIRGVDLSKPMPDAVLGEIQQALWQHLMVYFRDQALNPDSFGAVGQRFGPLHDEPFIPRLEGHSGIHHFRGVNTDQLSVQSLRWHRAITRWPRRGR